MKRVNLKSSHHEKNINLVYGLNSRIVTAEEKFIKVKDRAQEITLV